MRKENRREALDLPPIINLVPIGPTHEIPEDHAHMSVYRPCDWENHSP